jgi:hypothetical protein
MINAIMRCKSLKAKLGKQDLTLVVSRQRSTGEFCMAMPCITCIALITRIPQIKNITFSNAAGEWETLKPAQIAEISKPLKSHKTSRKYTTFANHRREFIPH